MIPASSLKAGMVLRQEGHLTQVLSTEHHMGGGKMGSLEHVKLRNLSTGAVLEKRFRPDERLEVVEVERRRLDYLYQDGDHYVFMSPETYDQIPIDREKLGAKVRFLVEGMAITGLFVEENPIAVVFPEHVDLRVVTAAPPLHEQDTSTYKSVTLENGIDVLVPQFIKQGDTIRLDSESGKYLGRL